MDPFDATLSSPGAANTDWSFTFDAPAASTYYYFVRAVDSAGQSTPFHSFGTGRLFPGDGVPTVTVNLPANNQIVTTNRIAVAGSATDDASLNGVQIRFRHVDTNRYLRADGTLGSSQWIDAALTNPGGVRSNFDYQTPVIPDGKWDVQIRSEDNNTQTSSTTRLTVTLN